MKARFAPIIPPHLMEKIPLGDYILLLAHEVVERPEVFRTLVGNTRAIHKDACIILDNSVVELGYVDFAMVREAMDLVKPDILVLPDVLGDPDDTRYAVKAFLHDGIHALTSGEARKPKLMPVIQTHEVADSPRYVADFQELIPGLEYIALPRRMTNDAVAYGYLEDTRFNHARELASSHPNMKIHLLGMSNNLFDDMICCGANANIIGIDSANPATLGHRRILMSLHQSPHMDRSKLWNCDPSEIDMDTYADIMTNFYRVRNWMDLFGHE